MEGGCSYAKSHSIVYKWEISGATSFIAAARLTNGSELITSPEFSAGSKFNDYWSLELQIKRDSNSSESNSWVSLYLGSYNYKKIRTKLFIYILDNENRKRGVDVEVITDPADSQQDYFFENLSGWGYENFVKIDELLDKKNEFLKNDTLTICVDLIVYDDYVRVINPTKPLEDVQRKLLDDFQDLFIAKKRSDVVIKIGDKTFDAHKLVLATRSSVFDAMFSHETKENKENEVTIPDVDPEVFEKVLEFIYTDKVEELDNYAEELLESADMYQLQGLELMCQISLCKSLTFENVARRLILADRHSTKKLKEAAIDYIAVNWDMFKTTEPFKYLEKSHPFLAYAIARKVIDRGEMK